MKRRQQLMTIGTIAIAVIAGCSSPETKGDDDNPIDVSPEELLPSPDLFGDSWEPRDMSGELHSVDLDGSTASASFAAGNTERIDVEVTVFDSVSGAMSGYEEMRDYDAGGTTDSVKDIEIASEGYSLDLGNSDFVYFRDANVIGEISHVISGGSSSLKGYAADWHETWRS